MSTHDILGALGWGILSFAIAWLGSRFFPDDEWYQELSKPAWNPPSDVFAPVWAVLYLFMATAAWLVWKQHGMMPALFPLGLYVAQLLLNAAWTWLFFGFHHIGLALLNVLVLWVLLLVTFFVFWDQSPLAGALLIPNLAWLAFAAALNAVIWQKNRSRAAA